MTKQKEKKDTEELLLKKKELLCLVLEIALKQKEYLVSDDVESLVDAVGQRQKLIDEIRELDKYIEDNDLKDSASYNSPRSQALLADIKSVLREITSEDKINIKAAEEKVEHFKQQIRSVKKNKNRIVSYQSAPANEDGIYIDKKK